MSSNFPYKYDVDVYIDKAIEKMKFTYPWVKREILLDKYRYAIEKVGNRYKYVSYYTWDDGKVDREIVKGGADEFIKRIMQDNYYRVESANPTKEVFKVPFACGTDAHGWYLERYEFRTHDLGCYSSFVQAGDRCTGGSREFFIPPSYLEGTFSDFLDKYMEMVPGGSFGLYREDLENTPGLKEFLGFKE